MLNHNCRNSVLCGVASHYATEVAGSTLQPAHHNLLGTSQVYLRTFRLLENTSTFLYLHVLLQSQEFNHHAQGGL